MHSEEFAVNVGLKYCWEKIVEGDRCMKNGKMLIIIKAEWWIFGPWVLVLLFCLCLCVSEILQNKKIANGIWYCCVSFKWAGKQKYKHLFFSALPRKGRSLKSDPTWLKLLPGQIFCKMLILVPSHLWCWVDKDKKRGGKLTTANEITPDGAVSVL